MDTRQSDWERYWKMGVGRAAPTTSAVPLCAASAETVTRQQAPAAPTKTPNDCVGKEKEKTRKRKKEAPVRPTGARWYTYKKCGDAEPRPYQVTHVWPRTGARASPDNAEVMSRWESVDDLTPFLEQQNAVPTDSFHPDVARVVKNMHLPPPGEQLSRERAGRVTGSSLPAFMRVSRFAREEAAEAGYADVVRYMVDVESGRIERPRKTHHMQRGNDEEPEILALFELVTGLELYKGSVELGWQPGRKCMGSLLLKGTTYAAAAPDGICARVPAFVECKSRDRATTADLYPEHYLQLQLQMAGTYDPDEKRVLVPLAFYVQYVSAPPCRNNAQMRQSLQPILSIRLVRFDPYLYHTILHTCETIGPMLRDASAQHGGRPPIPIQRDPSRRTSTARPRGSSKLPAARRPFVRRTPTAKRARVVRRIRTIPSARFYAPRGGGPMNK